MISISEMENVASVKFCFVCLQVIRFTPLQLLLRVLIWNNFWDNTEGEHNEIERYLPMNQWPVNKVISETSYESSSW